MCGIVGFIDACGRRSGAELQSIIATMTDSLSHRGPDDSGIWVDAAAHVAMGHRRLSILDLSPAGHQPMHSMCGRYVITFNGEIYNYQEVRLEIESKDPSARQKWRGHSDTEVMLAAFQCWSVEDAVKKFRGMFAFALWDRQDRILHLVRDRIGEKPLYYGYVGTDLVFGSELKVFRAHPGWRSEINEDVLTLFLRHNCIPAPYSIYHNVFKLLPGTIVTIPVTKLARQSSHTPMIPRAYWSALGVAESGSRTPFAGTEQEAVEELDHLLRTAVRQQMVADVPLGAFLSGGVDSSTIVALMQAQSARPVKSFTVGFQEEEYNEARDAKAVARYLGTDHTELYVAPGDALAVIPKLPELYDEPFSDVSQIPTYLISRLTRNYVTVSLSGDAGDELFAGYNRYLWGNSIWQSFGWMPNLMKTATAALLTALPPRSWETIFKTLNPVLPKRLRQRNTADKIQKLALALNASSPIDMYRRLASHWHDPTSIVLNATEPATRLTEREQLDGVKDFLSVMMYLDLVTFLPDDILVKVDRAAMGVSLETRLPFLDHRVVEFAWRIPLSMKVRNGRGKWLLRQVLNKYIPHELIERPKSGFAVPLDSWLRGPLRDWAEDLLDEKNMRGAGYFDPIPIRQKWQEHLSGRKNWQYQLWDVLMFQAWLTNQARGEACASPACAAISPAAEQPKGGPGNAGPRQREIKKMANSANFANWRNNPNSWLRTLFPTAHELLTKRSLQSLKVPAFKRVLVVGAGYDPYRDLFGGAKEYVRLDIKPVQGITDVVGDALALPFDANHFDCVFASEVLEHLSDPFLFVKEASRVLEPGGKIILTVPFMFHKHGDPHDYWRPTEQGLHELFSRFMEVRVQSFGNSLHVILDLVTTAFSPYTIFFPLRIFNHMLRWFPIRGNERLPSMAPSGFLVVATK